MSPELQARIIELLATDGFVERSQAETTYPPRDVPDGALITRIAPSPTGFVHLGTIYAALINQKLATQSTGSFVLRIEDTDKKREVEGAQQQIIDALDFFGLQPNELLDQGPYQPYIQSQRRQLYLGFAIELLRSGRAYPCFATTEDLENSYKQQTERKLRPGYYGEFALWRERSESEIIQALDESRPFVLRFRSTGSHQQRISFKDALKGQIELPENDLDVPLIKSDGLPTYHLAHVVDDYLMRVNLVLRGDEWLPSTPLHLELCQALSITPFNYAHFAPLSILDNGNKRKLSKRKDPEADVRFWQQAGYPPEAILEYLTTLASSDFEAWRAANPTAPLADFSLSMAKLAMSRAPLIDHKKLDDISSNVIANFAQADFETKLIAWLQSGDSELYQIMSTQADYTAKVLTIERDGQNRRKDIVRWDQAREQYGYFYDEIFAATANSRISQELASIPSEVQGLVLESFLHDFDINDDQPTWLDKTRHSAESSGYAADNKAFQQNPEQFKGSFADFVKIIRVYLTAKNRSPDLHAVMQIMGDQRVRQRLTA